MFIATDLPTPDERREALAAVPDARAVHDLTGIVRGALRNQAIDLIDVAIGPGQTRAALVSLYEGLDVLLQASLDLVESSVAEQVLSRVEIHDPLGEGELLDDPIGETRVPGRIARFAIEDAIVRIASAGDHFANAHLRLAWEANAATMTELEACRFDPNDPSPRFWQSVEDLRAGLEKLEGSPLGVLSSFVLNDAFTRYATSDDVQEARMLRHAVIHRERPSYREARAFGRTSLWTQALISLTFPPPDEVDDALPSLADRRAIGSEALSRSLEYATAIWDHAVRWLRTVDVWIEPLAASKQVRISTRVEMSGHHPYPRETRDPAPFLKV